MRSNRATEPTAPTAPSDEALEDFYKAITEAHLALQDPERAAKMQAYMKSDIPHFGVPKPQSRKLTMQLAKEHFGTDPLQRIAAAEFVWNKATHRDHLYAAQDTLDIASIRGNIEVLPLLTHMIDTGQWWDLVDAVQGHFSELLTTHQFALTKLLREWVHHENKWRRRTSIIAQLKLKKSTDTELLAYAITENAADKDFFIRKAAGWALREYAKSNEPRVKDLLKTHRDELSLLTIREASKHLLNSNHE